MKTRRNEEPFRTVLFQKLLDFCARLAKQLNDVSNLLARINRLHSICEAQTDR